MRFGWSIRKSVKSGVFEDGCGTEQIGPPPFSRPPKSVNVVVDLASACCSCGIIEWHFLLKIWNIRIGLQPRNRPRWTFLAKAPKSSGLLKA
jgi:hypothetical protein